MGLSFIHSTFKLRYSSFLITSSTFYSAKLFETKESVIVFGGNYNGDNSVSSMLSNSSSIAYKSVYELGF